MAEEDTEITLGIGKLLGLFFMLALTCGIFFAVGYSLGKTAEREQALKNQPAQTLPADPDIASSKPSGTPGSESKASPAMDNPADTKENAPDLTFYKAVKQNPGDETKPAEELKVSGATNPAAAKTAATKPHEMPPVNPVPSKGSGVERADASPSTAALTPQANPSGTFLVQIAAVTHEEDAAALAGALRKKSYAAAVVNSPNGKDKLFHVVLGPYASLQDAEAMKAKLQGEGYSPIVKR
ncbi:MAG: SPOR domain-containing protein [Candidatus Korobacteraceae bacterium]